MLGGTEGQAPDAMGIIILWVAMVAARACHGLVMHFYSFPIESEPWARSGQVRAVKLCGSMLSF